MVRSGEAPVLHQQVIVVLLLLSATLISAHQRSKQDVARGATPTTLLQVLCSPSQALPFADDTIRLLLSFVQKAISSWSCRIGVLQAWKSFCKGNISRCGDGKHLSPAPPTKGYIISLPEDAAARKHLEQTVHALGITTDHVPGVRSDQVFLIPTRTQATSSGNAGSAPVSQ